MRFFIVVLFFGCQGNFHPEVSNKSSMTMEENSPVFRNIVKIENIYSKGEYNPYQDTNPLNSQMPQKVEFFIQKDNKRCYFGDDSECSSMQTQVFSDQSFTLTDGSVGLYDLRALYPQDCGNFFDGQCSRHSPVTVQTTFSIYSHDNLILQKRFCLKFESASLFPKTVYRIAKNENDYMFFLDMKGYEAMEINKEERCF